MAPTPSSGKPAPAAVAGDIPDAVLAQVSVGDRLVAADRPREALAAFEAALALRPGDARILNKIGLAHRLLGDTAAAIEAYSAALSFDPSSVVARMNLGALHESRQDYGQAAEHYQRALEAKPGNLDILRHLSVVLSQLGRIEEALDALRKVVAAEPDDAPSHFRIARLVPHPQPDDDGGAIVSAYERSEPGTEQRRTLAFAMGKILEDRRLYAEAFQYFLEANAIHRAGYDYDEEEARQNFAAIKAGFSEARIARLSGGGYRDPTPIFIVGMPRSGTTLVEQVLSSHPRVHGAGELLILRDLVADVDIATVSRERLEELGREYVARLRQRAPASAEFITDKLPHNFLRVGFIRLMLPDAKIIHTRRDPADTCLSIFKALFGRGHRYAYDLKELGEHHNMYRDLMAHWRKVLLGAFYDCDYEEMVRDPEAVTRALLDWCGLEWNDTCLRFHDSSRKVKTASVGQVHRQIYTTSVDLSRRYGDALAPLLETLAKGP